MLNVIPKTFLGNIKLTPKSLSNYAKHWLLRPNCGITAKNRLCVKNNPKIARSPMASTAARK